MAGWVLRVVGKGQRLREVPVPLPVVHELLGYLTSRGLEPDPARPVRVQAFVLGLSNDLLEPAPQLQVRAFDPTAGIAPITLHDQMETYCAYCFRLLEQQGDTRGARRLAAASTHWLRHSHASHSIASGTPIEVAQ